METTNKLRGLYRARDEQGKNHLAERNWVPTSSGQRRGADGAAAVLGWRYALDPTDLPQWVHSDLRARGLRVTRRIGSTTYVSSIWRLERTENTTV